MDLLLLLARVADFVIAVALVLAVLKIHQIAGDVRRLRVRLDPDVAPEQVAARERLDDEARRLNDERIRAKIQADEQERAARAREVMRKHGGA